MPRNMFPCTIEECMTICKRKTDLDRHERIHSPNRKLLEHKCPEPGCNTSMLQLHNLNVHIKSQHRGFKWKCKYSSCSSVFSDPGARTRHMKRLHGYITNRQRSSALHPNQLDDLGPLLTMSPSPEPPMPSLANSSSSRTSTPAEIIDPLFDFGFGPSYAVGKYPPLMQPEVSFNLFSSRSQPLPSPWLGQVEDLDFSSSSLNFAMALSPQETGGMDWSNFPPLMHGQGVNSLDLPLY